MIARPSGRQAPRLTRDPLINNVGYRALLRMGGLAEPTVGEHRGRGVFTPSSDLLRTFPPLLQLGLDDLLSAVGTDAMAECRLGPLSDVRLDLLPVALAIPDSLAVGAWCLPHNNGRRSSSTRLF